MKIRQVIFLTQLSLLFVLIFIFFIFLFFLFFIFDTNEREPSLQGDTYNQPPAETARGDGTTSCCFGWFHLLLDNEAIRETSATMDNIVIS
jgi:hypothetical protein